MLSGCAQSLALRNGICLTSVAIILACRCKRGGGPAERPRRCAAAPACRLSRSLPHAHSALGVLRFVWAYFLRPRRNLRWYGQWAVVTGATDGIGKEYAAQLARQGGCWLTALGCCEGSVGCCEAMVCGTLPAASAVVVDGLPCICVQCAALWVQSTGVLPRLNRLCQPTYAAQRLTRCRLLPCSPCARPEPGAHFTHRVQAEGRGC